eukprot:40192-Heterocapsa_arctica.AAC.1
MSPSGPVGDVSGGSGESRTGAVPSEYGSPDRALFFDPTVTAPEGSRTRRAQEVPTPAIPQ